MDPRVFYISLLKCNCHVCRVFSMKIEYKLFAENEEKSNMTKKERSVEGSPSGFPWQQIVRGTFVEFSRRLASMGQCFPMKCRGR